MRSVSEGLRRFACCCSAAFVLASLSAPAAGDDRKDPVLVKLHATAAALRATGVKLTEADFVSLKEQGPPASVAAAGPEYVAAWHEYQRAMSLRRNPLTPPVSEPRINIAINPEAYAKSIQALLESTTPPTPEQFARFDFGGDGFCGNLLVEFGQARAEAIILASLLHRRWGEAVSMLIEFQEFRQPREDLLTALGFDWQKVDAGAWLAGKPGMAGQLCQNASDENARLLLRWAQSHWEEAALRGRPMDGPELPALELLQLFSSPSTVTPQTKADLAAFLNANATRLYDAQLWLERLKSLPPSAAKPLEPMLRASLKHEKNAVRTLAEAALRDAGIANAKAELRAAPRYRLFVDGQSWPELVTALPRPGHIGDSRTDLGLSIDYTDGNVTDRSPISHRGGVIKLDADQLLPAKRIRRASFDSFPAGFTQDAPSGAEPWIRAEIPLPAAFGEVTDIHVDTVAVTIKPHFPRPAAEYEHSVTYVDFGYRDESHPDSAPITRHYEIVGNGTLKIQRVQPGDYVLRVEAPGAARMDWHKIHVTKERPHLSRFWRLDLPWSSRSRGLPD